MSSWVAPEVAAELFALSMGEVEHRILTGIWPMKMDHGFVMLNIGDPADVKAAEAEPIADRNDEQPYTLPAMPETALPRTQSGAIAVDAIEFDYHAARVATARLRKPPQAN